VINSWIIRLAGHVEDMEDMRNACNILVGKPEGKRPLAIPRRRCEDNIRIDLWGIGREERSNHGGKDWWGM
jgi:hypothetical protein